MHHPPAAPFRAVLAPFLPFPRASIGLSGSWKICRTGCARLIEHLLGFGIEKHDDGVDRSSSSSLGLWATELDRVWLTGGLIALVDALDTFFTDPSEVEASTQLLPGDIDGAPTLSLAAPRTPRLSRREHGTGR